MVVWLHLLRMLSHQIRRSVIASGHSVLSFLRRTELVLVLTLYPATMIVYLALACEIWLRGSPVEYPLFEPGLAPLQLEIVLRSKEKRHDAMSCPSEGAENG
jgi:hypothetical protein